MFLVLIFVPRIIFYENKDLLGWCVVNVQLGFHIKKMIIEEAEKNQRIKDKNQKKIFAFASAFGWCEWALACPFTEL